jgi:type 2 lantibiotic biosynthesis protein LanM
VNWIGLNLFQERQWVLAPTLLNLYDGKTGIMLFLAYLWKITGDTRYIDMVEAGCRAMRRQVEQMKGEIKTVGAFDGWGSVIYLLSHLGVLWNDPNLFAEAREVAALLPELIERDVTFDVLSGSAGCTLSLLSLYHVAPSSSLLATAIQCGERLIGMAHPERSGMAWKNPAVSSRPLTGFSHGAAGCVLSLLALAEVSGEERFQRMALEALAYERSVFSAQAGNWPDFREVTTAGAPSPEQEDLRYMVSWCHGAPGIAMSRLAALRYLDDEALRQEIHIALATTIKQGFGLNHSLCHGDLGNLEALLLASRMLQDRQYSEHLDHFSRLILDSIEADGWLTGIPLGVEAPGLMTGLAGIGYELLRLADPERVPSVLLLDPPMLA